jgi:RNA polymerase sigma factor (sigma-70 family)
MPSLVQIDSINEQKFTQIFTQYRSSLHKQVMLMTRSEWHTQEIVQEVFLRVWIHREKLAEIKDMNAYLFKIARNLFINYCRLNKQKNPVTDHFLSNCNKNITQELIDQRELQRWLQLAIQSLSEQRRKVFVLGKIERWPREKIASILGISELTVKATMQNATRDVGKFLGPEYDKIPKAWPKKVKQSLMEMKMSHAA